MPYSRYVRTIEILFKERSRRFAELCVLIAAASCLVLALRSGLGGAYSREYYGFLAAGCASLASLLLLRVDRLRTGMALFLGSSLLLLSALLLLHGRSGESLAVYLPAVTAGFLTEFLLAGLFLGRFAVLLPVGAGAVCYGYVFLGRYPGNGSTAVFSAFVILLACGILVFILTAFGEDLLRQVRREALRLQEKGRELMSSLEEKETLLREIHHRVKNNLQIISSLLRLQHADVEDLRLAEILTESQNRIKSMALIHETLYTSGTFSAIFLPDYLPGLARSVFQSYSLYSRRVSLQCRVADIHLGVDIAVSLGLIVNELVTNALKHAFRDRESGELELSVERESPQRFRIRVCDNGIGFPADRLEQAETLGFNLVRALTSQIGGNLTVRSDKGSEFLISFPAEDLVTRG